MLIASIGSGSDLDETGGKAIGSAVALAAFSLTGMAGTSLAQRRPRLAPFGYLTSAVSLVAFLAVMVELWSSGLAEDGWRVPVYLTIAAVGTGHASLLLGSQRPEDSEAVRLVRAGVIVAIAMLCSMAIAEISSPGPDVGTRPIAVVAVLYVLGTVLLPLLRRVSPGRRPGIDSLP